jgi:diguanylate cyclase (GGDEF)-like protein
MGNAHLDRMLGALSRRVGARKALLPASIAMTAAILVVVATTLVMARSEAWEQAGQQSENIRRAVAEDVRSQITLYSRMLDIAQGFLGGPQFAGLPADLTSGMLSRMARDFETAGVIIVLDANGFSVADSANRSKRTDNFADRPYFAVQRDQADVGLFVGAPYQSRLRAGDPSFALSRRITDDQGQFAGVVVAAIRLEHFRTLFSSIVLGPKSTISLVNNDGVVMMRQPSSDAHGDVGRDISASANFREIKGRSSGSLVATTSIDGVERLITFGEVTGYPLLVSVAVATEEILADWWLQVLLIGGFSSAAGVVLILLAFLLQEKVNELEKATALLTGMASTDALTGLCNRREFEVTAYREWQRALREHTPLSVLMVDADSFKQVNDNFGHAEGDRVLRELALLIRGNLLRPTDVAARYGGEEFAVLLPNTDGAGAMKVAETIRVAVAAWRDAHEGAKDSGPAVTVSIGAGSTIPDGETSFNKLVAAADAALYIAKMAGRNRSELAQPGSGMDALHGLPAPKIQPPLLSSGFP